MERDHVDILKRLVSSQDAGFVRAGSAQALVDSLVNQFALTASQPAETKDRSAESPRSTLDPLSTVSLLAGSELSRRASGVPTVSGKAAPSSDTSNEGSAVSTALKTIGLLTGVGPVVTGILSLFGGSGGSAEPATLPTFTLPPAVHVNAGLQSDGSIAGVQYGAGGQIRSAPTANMNVPNIQVNVHAMDSRSFLDHSGEIAAAVRKAMLQSSSLNDVVSEL